MHRRVAARFTLALLSCAIPAHVAFASTNAAAASPIGAVQEFVVAVVNSTEAIIAEAETGISGVVAPIASLASSGAPTSYSAAVAASQASPAVPAQPPLAAPNTAPKPPTEAQVLPVVQYDAVATPPSTDNILELQSRIEVLNHPPSFRNLPFSCLT